jgi:hypothetical protein
MAADRLVSCWQTQPDPQGGFAYQLAHAGHPIWRLPPAVPVQDHAGLSAAIRALVSAAADLAPRPGLLKWQHLQHSAGSRDGVVCSGTVLAWCCCAVMSLWLLFGTHWRYFICRANGAHTRAASAIRQQMCGSVYHYDSSTANAACA